MAWGCLDGLPAITTWVLVGILACAEPPSAAQESQVEWIDEATRPGLCSTRNLTRIVWGSRLGINVEVQRGLGDSVC